MVSTMRCSRSFRSVLLAATLPAFAGCSALSQQTPGDLAVRSARLSVNGSAVLLDLGLDCRLSGPMQDALDQGIPITLRIELRAGRWPQALHASQRVELRYFPLSRRYQLRELDADDTRTFAAPASLVAALGSLHLNLPAAFAKLPVATPLRVSAGIDPAALPGALRLPALFEPAWRFTSTDYAWTLAAQ